jgi:tetratricopeptide (TPR) repeat protein
MYVRRDYSQPFFRERRRPAYLRWLLVLLLCAALGYGVYRFVRAPEEVMDTVYTTFISPPTPTPFPSTLAQRANDLYLAGDLEGSAGFYQQAVAQRPDNVDYLYEYGQILIDLNRADEALDIADQIIAVSPADVLGPTLKTRGLAWIGQYTAAVPIGLAALQIDANFAPLHEALSRAYIGSQEWRKGLDFGFEATELAPGDVRARWAYANALMAVGESELATAELEIAISIHPGFVAPYFELAFLYLAANRDQDAIDTYDRILALQPRNARALLRQCEAYRKVGEFERALGLCQDSVDVDPTYAQAQYRLGQMRYNRREFAAARDAFRACLSLQSGSLECKYRLALAHYYIAQTDYLDCLNVGGTACNTQRTNDDCRTGWIMLQEALAQAQTLDNVVDDVEIIREGLSAIANDAACPQFNGQRPPESTPEATPEATSEA